MTEIVLTVAAMAALAAATIGLVAWSERAGDRVGDVIVREISFDPPARAVRFTAYNPGSEPVLIGASVTPPSLRLWCEGDVFVRVPRRSSRESLGAARHDIVCIVDAGEAQAIAVPVGEPMRRRAQLVVAVGERDRLRIVHRAVRLPLGPRPAPAQPRQEERLPTR